MAPARGWSNRSLFPKAQGLVFVFLLCFVPGCVNDEDRQTEIRQKVIAGECEEARKLAHEYFADDKRILLVTLEYIATQEKKALREAYKNNVLIENLRWSTDGSGVVKVSGRLRNRGDKTITGFGNRAACARTGEVVRTVPAGRLANIQPGMYEDFEFIIKGFKDCDDITAHVIDVGLK